MIRINAIVLIVIFGFMLVKPAIPFIDYLARRDFIIENFCINKDKKEMKCNGKCHLKEQVREEKSSSSEEDLPFPPQEQKNEWRDYLMGQIPESRPLRIQAIIITAYSPEYKFQYIQRIFHPPMKGISP
jgi:hypothetical protein